MIPLLTEPEYLCLMTFPVGIHSAMSWNYEIRMYWTCIIMTLVSFSQHAVNILCKNKMLEQKYVFYALWLDRLCAAITVYHRFKYIKHKTIFIKSNLFINSLILIILLDSGLVKDKQEYFVLHTIWHITSFSLLNKYVGNP